MPLSSTAVACASSGPPSGSPSAASELIRVSEVMCRNLLVFSGNGFVKLPLSCEREPAVWNEAAEGEFNYEILLRGA